MHTVITGRRCRSRALGRDHVGAQIRVRGESQLMEHMALVYFKEEVHEAPVGAIASLIDLFQTVGICLR